MRSNHCRAMQSWPLILLMLVAAIASCTPAHKLNYFNNLPDSTIVRLPPVVEEERVIGKGDNLDIAINAKDQEAVSPFNKQASTAVLSGTPGAQPAGMSSQGYTVDPTGVIEMPVLGKIDVKGMTSRQLKTRLPMVVSPYLKEPIVEVKFTSFPVTVLGEVRSPGMFNLSGNTRTSILEALAAAGDLPHSAKKYNIHLYRDYNGQRTVTKINLNDKSILYNQQPFQMKPNDVLYIQTRRGSIFREDFGLVASIVTLVVSVVTLGIAISK